MNAIAGFPYWRIDFDKSGHRFAPVDLQSLMQDLAAAQTTDLIVISHGWNNDTAEAYDLYARYFSLVAALLENHTVQLPGRKLAVLGIFWPSKKFTDESLISSGAASLGAGHDASLRQTIASLKDLCDDPAAIAKLNRAEDLIPELPTNDKAREEFAKCVIAVLPTGSPESKEDGAELLQTLSGDELFERLNVLPTASMAGDDGGAAVMSTVETGPAAIGPPVGSATSVGDLIASARAAAEQLLNYTTYYKMKERAGDVGTQGVAPLLQAINHKLPQVNFHLVGHSFGGRLVTAAAMATPAESRPRLRSMLLLQAAFSHSGFAKELGGGRSGFFRNVIDRKAINGPILVTHTRNDRAVGLAYAVASRVARDDACALGDANDPYGGIGSNGAQHTPEATESTLTNQSMQLSAGKVYNLLADNVIPSHSEVCKPETARMLLEAIRAAQ